MCFFFPSKYEMSPDRVRTGKIASYQNNNKYIPGVCNEYVRWCRFYMLTLTFLRPSNRDGGWFAILNTNSALCTYCNCKKPPTATTTTDHTQTTRSATLCGVSILRLPSILLYLPLLLLLPLLLTLLLYLVQVLLNETKQQELYISIILPAQTTQ